MSHVSLAGKVSQQFDRNCSGWSDKYQLNNPHKETMVKFFLTYYRPKVLDQMRIKNAAYIHAYIPKGFENHVIFGLRRVFAEILRKM